MSQKPAAFPAPSAVALSAPPSRAPVEQTGQSSAPKVTVVPLPEKAQVVAITVQTPNEPHDYASDLMSGGIGLVGALVGAFAAYMFGLRASERAKRADDMEKDGFLSFSAILKLQNILSAQGQIIRHIEEGRELMAKAREAAKDKGDGVVVPTNPSLFVVPFTNTPERVHFTTEEVIRAGRVGGNATLNIVSVIDGRHNAAMDLIDTYRTLKADFAAKAGVGRLVGGAMQYGMTKESWAAVAPILHLQDELVEELYVGAKTDSQAGYDAMIALMQGRARLLGKEFVYQVKAPDGRQMIVTATTVSPAPSA